MKKSLQCGKTTLDLSVPVVMGILNVTPDSFSDGGRYSVLDTALLQVESMLQQGARIIDVGGESTRPGAQSVSDDEEIRRVIPVIENVMLRFPQTVLSIDTSKPKVMRYALEAGASVINDVNALRAEGAVEIAGRSNAAICLMHMQGEPRTMQAKPHYNNVVEDVLRFLQDRVDVLTQAGVAASRLIVDPGFGFGKNLQHNLRLLNNLAVFSQLNATLLVGVSRKSFIGTILDKPVEERLFGSLAMTALAVTHGADIIRAHDVAPTVDVIKICTAVTSLGSGD